MKQPVLIVASLILIVACAAGLRLACLDNRPMHTDEAVHAIKFGWLLEQGQYEYNPHEYHGPTLNYMSVPIAKAPGAESLVEVTETDLHLLPALCGIVLVAGVWLLRDALGPGAMLCAGLLTAISTAMVFYSRYYIQEMLLVCFTFLAIAALWRYARRGSKRWFSGLGWLVIAGLCIGLMHATKETFIIALFSMVLAGSVVAVWTPAARAGWTRPNVRSLACAAGVVIVVAVFVSITLFSFFFANSRGPVDSIATYGNYLNQAAGQGSAGLHRYPWFQYLKILLCGRSPADRSGVKG